jgi:hypothetical protein
LCFLESFKILSAVYWWREEDPFHFDEFHFCCSRVIGLDNTTLKEVRKSNRKIVERGKIYTLTQINMTTHFFGLVQTLQWKVVTLNCPNIKKYISNLYSRPYMHIFSRIFLSNYWWQKSDIWSQALYRYPISWEGLFGLHL